MQHMSTPYIAGLYTGTGASTFLTRILPFEPSETTALTTHPVWPFMVNVI